MQSSICWAEDNILQMRILGDNPLETTPPGDNPLSKIPLGDNPRPDCGS